MASLPRADGSRLYWIGWAGAAEAAPQVIEATGVYIMGDNDSPKIARDAARQEAMRAAVEKAGVYVESYSRTKNMQLTEDDVKMISGAVLKVIKEDSVPELSGTTMKYTVHLTAEVDTDNIDFKAMMAKKDEVEKLQQERDALKKQNEELLQQYQKANGQEKKSSARALRRAMTTARSSIAAWATSSAASTRKPSTSSRRSSRTAA